MNTDTALHHLAQYFNTTPIVVMLWICAIAVVVIFAVGYACIEMATSTPEPASARRRGRTT